MDRAHFEAFLDGVLDQMTENAIQQRKAAASLTTPYGRSEVKVGKLISGIFVTRGTYAPMSIPGELVPPCF